MENNNYSLSFDGFGNSEVVEAERRLRRLRGNVLSPKVQLRVGVWNCQTLGAYGRIQDLVKDLGKHDIEIACLTEARIPGTGSKWAGKVGNKNYFLYYSGHPAYGQNGVAIAVTENAKKSFVSESFVNERIMTARFQQTTGFMTIVVCYAPTDCTKDVATKNNFYADLNRVMTSIPKQDLVIVAGDMNAEIGSGRVGWGKVRGPFGSGVLNDNGSRLLNFASDNNLKIANSFFQHKMSHQLTWYSNDRVQTKKTSDYLLVSSRFFSSVMDVKVRLQTSLLTDHKLVLGVFQLKAQKMAPPVKKLDIKRLEVPVVRDAYKNELENRVRGLVLPVDIDEAWDKVESAIHGAGNAVLGYAKSRRTDRFISLRSQELSDARRAATDEASRKTLAKGLRRSLRRDEREYWGGIATEMEVAIGKGNTKTLFGVLKRVMGKSVGLSEALSDEKGEPIVDKSKRLPRWTQYFEALLNRPPPITTDEELKRAADAAIPSPLIDCEPPENGTIREVVMKLKNWKASGRMGYRRNCTNAEWTKSYRSYRN